jgi:hypothetical protein
MLLGYAHSANKPPAFPEAPPAIFVASRSVIECLLGSNDGWRERKYAEVQPMIPPPMIMIFRLPSSAAIAAVVSVPVRYAKERDVRRLRAFAASMVRDRKSLQERVERGLPVDLRFALATKGVVSFSVSILSELEIYVIDRPHSLSVKTMPMTADNGTYESTMDSQTDSVFKVKDVRSNAGPKHGHQQRAGQKASVREQVSHIFFFISP